MICPVCKCGQMKPGFTSVTLERGGMTLLVKQVPAEICDNCGDNCGEEYIDESAIGQLLQTNGADRSGESNDWRSAQLSSLGHVWDNPEDEVWNDVPLR